jgi:multidrug/hemolysin transport system permease protein
MKDILALIKRNTKLFFKDKGLFFTSMVTPLILLLLYTTFLGKVYRDSLTMSIAQGIVISESIIEGIVGGQLFSSLLAVSCVTVAFCSNMLMVQDKMSGARNDLLLTPVKKGKMAIAYYFSTLISTLIVAVFALIACFIYLAIVGWYLSFMDILLLVLDILLLTSFGTVLSSIINCFLSTQGQISAVGTIVSAGYGFICGAYMPISTFSAGLQNAIAFLPGTYGTALMRTHALSGAFEEMLAEGVPLEAVEGIKSSVDCSVSFFGNTVSEPIMYLVLGGSVVLLIGVYILIHKLTIKKK